MAIFEAVNYGGCQDWALCGQLDCHLHWQDRKAWSTFTDGGIQIYDQPLTLSGLIYYCYYFM